MALFGSPSVTLTYDDSGGTARTMTAYALTINGVKIESAMQASHAFGDSWEESTPVGIQKVNDVVIGGFYDDTATTGPHVVFRSVDTSPSASTRTLAIAFGGTNGTFTIETRCMGYEVKPKNGALTEFEAVVRPTGSGAWS